jgi:hypothetical protein
MLMLGLRDAGWVDCGALRANIVDSSRSEPEEDIINLRLLCSIKSDGVWMCMCVTV